MTTVYFYRATVELESGDGDLDAEELWNKYGCGRDAEMVNERITDDYNDYDIED